MALGRYRPCRDPPYRADSPAKSLPRTSRAPPTGQRRSHGSPGCSYFRRIVWEHSSLYYPIVSRSTATSPSRIGRAAGAQRMRLTASGSRAD